MPQLSFLDFGTFWCLSFSGSISRLTWGVTLAWAATMLTENNTANATEKYSEKLICFPGCFFHSSIHSFISHGGIFLLKYWKGVPHTLLLSGSWVHQQPLQSFPFSEVFGYLWWGLALMECSCVTWDQTAVKGVVKKLWETVLEASAGSGAQFQFRLLSLALVWATAQVCTCLTLYFILGWLSCLISDLPYDYDLVQLSLSYWLTLVTVSGHILLLGSVGLSLLVS